MEESESAVDPLAWLAQHEATELKARHLPGSGLTTYQNPGMHLPCALDMYAIEKKSHDLYKNMSAS